MPDFQNGVTRIDRTLVGDSLQVGGHRVTPVARLTGRAGGGAQGSGGGGGAWLRLRPTELRVSIRDSAPAIVPITDPQRDALRGMAVQMVATALAGIVLVSVAWIRRAR